ncbi:MAG: transposase [Caulobacteraceae bacterium]
MRRAFGLQSWSARLAGRRSNWIFFSKPCGASRRHDACGDYARRLQELGILASMSRGGCPYDNAKAESLMKTLKTEEVDGSAYRDLDHARGAVGDFIEDVYNRTRLHSALDYRSPMEFEDDQALSAVRRTRLATEAICP